LPTTLNIPIDNSKCMAELGRFPSSMGYPFVRFALF
jgi:hypothetical protein